MQLTSFIDTLVVNKIQLAQKKLLNCRDHTAKLYLIATLLLIFRAFQFFYFVLLHFCQSYARSMSSEKYQFFMRVNKTRFKCFFVTKCIFFVSILMSVWSIFYQSKTLKNICFWPLKKTSLYCVDSKLVMISSFFWCDLRKRPFRLWKRIWMFSRALDIRENLFRPFFV